MTASDDVIDLRDKLGPIGDQGRRGTCVAFALTALHWQVRGSSEPALSEEFAYWSAKTRDSLAGDGTTYPAAVAGLGADGQSTALLWPYHETTSHLDPGYAPSAPATTDASRRRARGSTTSITISSLRAILAAGSGIAIAIPVWEGFELADGISVVPVPSDIGTMVVEHAVVVAGHDPNARSVLVRNSWGIGWGDGGYAWIDDALPTAMTESSGWTLTPISPVRP